MIIIIDDLNGREISDFLTQHIEDMKASSPPESKHVLDLDGLKSSDITFWSVWDNNKIVACGALKELTNSHGELKSMRTDATARRTGVASNLLEYILQEACHRQYAKVSLETGAMPFFIPAHKLYRNAGFKECPPFANYNEDPNSIFMTKQL